MVSCGTCKQWLHACCEGMSDVSFDLYMSDKARAYVCLTCKTVNVTSILNNFSRMLVFRLCFLYIKFFCYAIQYYVLLTVTVMYV